ncbi:HD domain-containing phosphohydrolase [Limisalsivibrio acetivorans]|uniref:HD domain-containing phosphohydrolase n=1 Tax=Limisalsivibrio acetivorans TaxID=1304888 RepID=UPI0003B5DC4F|nr:HD domain-containing phosphohydrolase [Limisalsivibrio acetivorans]
MKRFWKSYTIFQSLTIFAVALVVTVGLSIMLISGQQSEKALHSLADGIMVRTLENAKVNIGESIGSAVRISSILQVAIEENGGLPRERAYLRKLMLRSLLNHQNVYTVYYGNEKGEFFLVGKREREDGVTGYFAKESVIDDGVRRVTEKWMNTRGEVVAVTDLTETDTYDPRVRPWYEKAKRSGTSVWSDPYIFYITGQPGLTYAIPFEQFGEFKGVVGADLEVKTISLANLSSYTPNTQFFVADGEGRIIAHSELDKFYKLAGEKGRIPRVDDFGDTIVESIFTSHRENLRNMDLRDIRIKNKSYKTIFGEHRSAGLQFLIGLYTPYGDYLEPLRQGEKQILILSIIVIIMAVLFSMVISSALAKPFVILSRATGSVANLEFGRTISINTKYSEANVLVDNFNEMLENLNNYKVANEYLNENLREAHLDTFYRLALAAEYKDYYTAEHLNRVSALSVFIADALGMGRKDVELIKHSSAMHDVGKIGVPDNILMKPGKLTAKEYDVIKKHSEIGAKILENPSSELMEWARIVALNHHERWDGKGYPNGIAGEDIPLSGRIVAIADVMDALLSKRSYKDAFSFEKTMDIIVIERGKQFEPELVDLISKNEDRVRGILL